MTSIGKEITGLLRLMGYGALAIYVYSHLMIKAAMEDTRLLVLGWVALCLTIASLGSLRHVSPQLGAVGETFGFLVGSAIAGGIRGFSRGSGTTNRATVKSLKDASFSEAVDQIKAAEDEPPIINVMKLQMTLDAMVMRAHSGESISRDTMVKLDLTTQPYWSLANQIVKMLRLRPGFQWRSTGSERGDLAYIRRCTVLDPQFVKVEVERHWYEVDLQECHFI